MRQRAFSRPVPIKTNLTVKAGLHDDKPQPLITPLTPRTELELRRSCRILLSGPAASPYAASPAQPQPPRPIQASKTPVTTTSKDNLDLVRHLYEKPHPPPPPPLESPPLSPAYIFTPAIAKKFSVCDLSLRNSGSESPNLRRRPTLIDVSSRPKTADMRTRRVLDRINQQPGEKGGLGLFPRPSTSHNEKVAFKGERPLPPLPGVQRSRSDNEVVLGKGKGKEKERGLRGIRDRVSGWFGKKKAVAAAV